VRAIFWVPAITRESFEQAYREIGILLRIPGITDDKADVKQLIKATLSSERFGPWLIVVDNADDDSILFELLNEGSSKDRLIDYLPHSRNGSIVFTTRNAKLAVRLAGSNLIQLSELNQAEAKKMLAQHLPTKELLKDEEVVHEFLKLLTYLPLAIVQAVAFVVGNTIRLSEYISIYRGSERDATDLLSRDFEDQGRYRQTQNPVAITWYISFNKIQKHDKLAAEYLSLMAYTTGEAVPASLLRPGSTRLATTEALGTLKAYAFITERYQQTSTTEAPHYERAFNIHRLVRLATRNWLRDHNQGRDWASKVVTRLAEIVPSGDYNTREIWTTYLPHAIYVVNLPDACEAESRLSLLAWVGRCQHTLGQYRAAGKSYQEVLAFSEKMLGRDHLRRLTLTTMNNLGQSLSRQGKYAEAEAMHQEALILREKVSGKDHQHTLTSKSNLAEALSKQGKYAKAEAIHHQVLALREKVLGKEHPDTLTSVHNLAKVLSKQGKYAEAEVMHEQELVLSAKVLGKEHTDVLASMNSLALVLGNRGKYAEAEAMHKETLELREKVLGKEHPYTLTSMHNLAKAVYDQGKHEKAEAMYRDVLTLREKVSGREHPHTLLSMNNLALALGSQGKYVEAEAMHKEALELSEKALGKEHPHTLTSMHNFAGALSDQGKYAEAEAMYKKALELNEKALGKEHPDTLSSVSWLGYSLQNQHQYKEALVLYRRAYLGYRDTFGPDHSRTRSCLYNYNSVQHLVDASLSRND
jgi:tetratricopeptide (TPR) repeat protein